MADKKGVKLIVTFAERGRGKALAKLYAEQGVFCSYQCMGRGTASSDLLDVLGVGTAEKDILISYAAKETAEGIRAYMERYQVEDIKDLIGAVHQ